MSQRLQHTADNVDGLYLMLGPLGALYYLDRARQSTFGGQVVGLRVRERKPIATLGLAFGALRYTTADRGRAWVDLIVGTRIRSVHVGVGIGPVLELDQVAPARVGGQASVWLFAGIIPYLRVGHVVETGTFLEMGLQLMLPARRW